MKLTQEQKRKTSTKTEAEVETSSAAPSDTDIDDLMAEIDSVLEVNAEEFVAGYQQKGGQ